jgi:hypothetical protein
MCDQTHSELTNCSVASPLSHSIFKDLIRTKDCFYSGFVHVGGSATGRVRRLERRSGSVLWEQDYGSPLVALYTKQGQDIVALPFTSIAEASLDSIPFHHHDNFL